MAFPEGLHTLTAPSNRLIGALPDAVRELVEQSFERVRVPLRTTIYEPCAPIDRIYFPIDAVISVVTVMRDGTPIEVVTVGNEGLTGAQALLDGATTGLLTWCQVGGEAYRMPFAGSRGCATRIPSYASWSSAT